MSVFPENVIPVLDCFLDDNSAIRSSRADQVDIDCLRDSSDTWDFVRVILRDVGDAERSKV